MDSRGEQWIVKGKSGLVVVFAIFKVCKIYKIICFLCNIGQVCCINANQCLKT